MQRRVAKQAEPSTIPSIVHEVLRSPGQPLDPATRAYMESRFGHDFSRVRVHTDAKAVESARAVNALAYTRGHDIAFGTGQYAPGGTTGKRLLAHELTHVVQQRRSAVQARLRLGPANDTFEREADSVADAVLSAPPCERSALQMRRGAGQIQRQVGFEEEEPPEIVEELEDEAADGDAPLGPGLREVGELSEAQMAGTVEVEEFEEAPEEIAEEEVAEPEAELEEEREEETAGLGLQFKKPPKKSTKKTSRKKKTTKKKVTRRTVRASKKGRSIKRIDVDLSSQKLKITWSDGKKETHIISSGRGRPGTPGDPCKDQNKGGSWCTGTGKNIEPKFLTGENYRNNEGDSMKWYVEYDEERNIGFHGGQRVTGKPRSHGCVRVHDHVAKKIHENVTTKTVINITGKAPTKPWGKKKAVPKKPTSKKAKPKATSKGRVHKVKRGDTVDKLARKYGVSEDAIVKANGLKSRHEIKAGQTLIIPKKK